MELGIRPRYEYIFRANRRPMMDHRWNLDPYQVFLVSAALPVVDASGSCYSCDACQDDGPRPTRYIRGRFAREYTDHGSVFSCDSSSTESYSPTNALRARGIMGLEKLLREFHSKPFEGPATIQNRNSGLLRQGLVRHDF
jgi:hypothetical protein